MNYQGRLAIRKTQESDVVWTNHIYKLLDYKRDIAEFILKEVKEVLKNNRELSSKYDWIQVTFNQTSVYLQVKDLVYKLNNI